MEMLKAVIEGIVEGLTEFAPVSSTGHLILVGDIIGFTGEKAKTFEIIIQLGSILAVVVLYFKRFLSLFGLYKIEGEKHPLNLLHIIIAGIPAVILGLLFHDFIKDKLFSPATVLVGLVAGGILLIYANKKGQNQQAHRDSLDRINYIQAFQIGLFQCLSLWPGFSRSGSTISGGLIIGAGYKASAEFSFILAVPMMIGASGLDLLKSLDTLSTSDIPLFVTGFLTAFIVALIAIVFFLKLLQRVKLVPFAIYRFILSALFLIYMYF
ncbi:undecaprenyl-diphosphatase [Pullulanibacillus pueri]|uniref:Undecaprenyl-diphosphatase n=1 Tax=Pullulanibacillus pueri TaxID=1437324 RepID=A0A8J2ZXL1_9BACL|nr:undecaprenyl-diphosphate phosphatase [Pullulanibacillus pueri]MBM7680654.1 undecaprenyl-diphosphatase [Pullulanibacillus pueri]GGH83833.1 undecaprenyl-diphosphatase 2 [Pullulanibacillus pueri]